MEKTKFILVSAFIVGVLFIIGCAGNVSNQGGTGTENSAAVEKDLADILSNNPKYTADYDVTSEGKTQKMTMAMDLPNFAIVSSTEEGSVHMYTNNEEFVMCTDAEGEWACLKFGGDQSQESQASTIETFESDVEEGKSVITRVGTCQRAGLTGQKFEVIDGEGYKSTVCYTNDGIPLEMISEDSTMIATKVSKSIDSKMFTPEAEPQDLASMMGQYQ